MRFDLLDEYATLVPFGSGGSRIRAFQDPAVPAEATQQETTVSLASHLELLRKSVGALCHILSSGYRKLIA